MKSWTQNCNSAGALLLYCSLRRFDIAPTVGSLFRRIAKVVCVWFAAAADAVLSSAAVLLSSRHWIQQHTEQTPADLLAEY